MYKLSREERKAYNNALQTLAELHLYVRARSNQPGDTVALLVDRFGADGAKETVALAIQCRGEWDKRISDRNRQWADEVLSLGYDISHDGGIVYPHEVHPAHLDMIADEMRKLVTPKQLNFTFDSSDLNAMRALMDKYGTSETMFAGVNTQKEKTTISIYSDKIIYVTYQHNGWVRKNTYWCDGVSEETFDGRWKSGGKTEEAEILEEFAKTQKPGGSRMCPRCGEHTMAEDPIRNALSRAAKIKICDACGMDEAIRAYNRDELPIREWAVVVAEKRKKGEQV